MFSHRPEYNSPEYKAFRYAVFARDSWQCQLCHTKAKELNAHHIIKWSESVHLRYAISNGITLCVDCHDNLVTGREEEFAPRFRDIVALKKISDVKKKEAKTGKKAALGARKFKSTYKYRPRNPRLRF